MGDAMTEQELPAVDANTLARLLGVPPKEIYDLAKAGVIERQPGKMFALEDAVRKYCDHLRRQATERVPNNAPPISPPRP
jgi:hypothetical protein